jgi:hypothetical protein
MVIPKHDQRLWASSDKLDRVELHQAMPLPHHRVSKLSDRPLLVSTSIVSAEILSDEPAGISEVIIHTDDRYRRLPTADRRIGGAPATRGARAARVPPHPSD